MSPRYKFTNIYERTVHTMFVTICVLALIYCIVLLSLVFSAIERKQNILASRDLTSTLSSLEVNYANKVATINENALLSNGFIKIDGTSFAVRKDPIASYTVLYAR